MFSAVFNKIKTQFVAVLKVFRSDNALEFLSSTFQNIFCDRGIIHETSCTHTTHQTGVSKRKHKTLLEILSCQFPKFYWPDALQLACYLINRMPSSVTANKILYSIMHPNKPMPNVKPKVFGCTCFVYLHTGQKDKLSAKSIRCIFVGYSRTQKGHCFFSPSMKKRFVTSDVTCFESCPYYPLQNKFVDESPVLNT